MENAVENETNTGTLTAWISGSGDSKSFNLVHVAAEGVTLSLNVKNQKTWAEIATAATESPEQASSLMQEQTKSTFLAANEISKTTFSEKLNQLFLFDQNLKKTKVPEGDELEQAEIFAAIKQHLGGKESEQEADTWAILQKPLMSLSITGLFGGGFIWFTTIADPNYEATGRRSGMKNLFNWLAYTVGTFWASVAVAAIMAVLVGMLVSQLVKRPIVKVLEYSI